MGIDTNRISLFLMKLLSIGLFLFAAYLVCSAFLCRNVLLFLCCGLPVGVVAACLIVHYYLPEVAESIVDSVLMPRRFLKEAPMILSTAYGNLARGAYAKVILEFQGFPARAFHDPEVVYVYAQACMNMQGYRIAGLEKMESFFHRSHHERKGDINLQLLMFYADHALKYRSASDITRLLERELKQRCYTENEKRAICTRCAAFRKDIVS